MRFSISASTHSSRLFLAAASTSAYTSSRTPRSFLPTTSDEAHATHLESCYIAQDIAHLSQCAFVGTAGQRPPAAPSSLQFHRAASRSNADLPRITTGSNIQRNESILIYLCFAHVVTV